MKTVGYTESRLVDRFSEVPSPSEILPASASTPSPLYSIEPVDEKIKFNSTPSPSWIWKILPEQNLKNLADYKYNSEDKSFLAKLFLRKFWDWSIEFFPKWLACVFSL
jgi:hypothetical protein